MLRTAIYNIAESELYLDFSPCFCALHHVLKRASVEVSHQQFTVNQRVQ